MQRKPRVEVKTPGSPRTKRPMLPPGPEIGAFASYQSHHNLAAAELLERALARQEGHISKHGALVVLTGQHTGRSAADKFVVRDAASEKQVWWDNNKPMTPAHFDAL